METLILIVHVLVALAVIVLVLVQQGKGADAGASFGSGASNTVFGSQGSATFLSRLTAVLAAVFFVTSFGLAMVAKNQAVSASSVGVPQAPVQVEKKPVEKTEVPSSDAPVVGSSKVKAAGHGDAPASE